MAPRLRLAGPIQVRPDTPEGQLITLEGTLRYREVESEGQPKQRLAEMHASSLKRLSKVEATDDPHDGAGED